jgi:hypothetical protein
MVSFAAAAVEYNGVVCLDRPSAPLLHSSECSLFKKDADMGHRMSFFVSHVTRIGASTPRPRPTQEELSKRYHGTETLLHQAFQRQEIAICRRHCR